MLNVFQQRPFNEWHKSRSLKLRTSIWTCIIVACDKMMINNNKLIAAGGKVLWGGKSSSHEQLYLFTYFNKNEAAQSCTFRGCFWLCSVLCWCESDPTLEEQQFTATTRLCLSGTAQLTFFFFPQTHMFYQRQQQRWSDVPFLGCDTTQKTLKARLRR